MVKKLTVGSLFAGIGGFDLGLERTGGFEVRWQCEIDDYCRRVLAKHWPNITRYGDIRTLTDVERVDVLCGGFPCQDISNAGKRAGIDGDRSGLWSEYVRIIRLVRPRYVLVENVAALLGRGMGRVLGDLSEIGYDAEWDVIPASAVGAPHRRERIWIVAYRNGESESTMSVNAGTVCTPDASDAACDLRRASRNERSVASDGGGPLLAHASSQRFLRRDSDFNSTPERDWTDEAVWCPDGLQPEMGHSHSERSHVAGSNKSRLSPRNELGNRKEAPRGIFAWGESVGTLAASGREQWTTEPSICRVVDGLSFELDCIRRMNDEGDDSKTKSATPDIVWRYLRAMWEHRQVAATSPELYRDRLRDCLPEMPHGDPLSRWLLGPRIEEDQGLCDLWTAFYASPFDEAQDLQRRLLERIGQKKRPEALGSQVDRLKGLGNAVVPQIVQWIGNQILAFD